MRIRLLCLLAIACGAGGAGAGEGETMENLRAFARLYGYVRFFHPSDEAAALDWNAFAVHGAGRVRDAADAGALRGALRELFAPVAPYVQVEEGEIPPPDPVPPDGARPVAWQHYGVFLSDKSNIYRSVRVGREAGVEPLFERLPEPGEATVADLGRGLSCRVPLVLGATDDGTLPRMDPKVVADLTARLAAIDLDPADLNVRLGTVIAAWNVLQHFYPYFDVVDVDWEQALTDALAGAMAGPEGFPDVLRRMVAKLRDGHGVVFVMDGERRSDRAPGEKEGKAPVRLAWIEDRVVVTAVEGTDLFEPGDVVLTIDGVPAAKELARIEGLISGSPQLVRYRALNWLGAGPADSPVAFGIERGGETLEVPAERSYRRFNLFFTAIDPYGHPGFEALGDGLCYVNLGRIDPETWDAHLDELVAAKGVILDWRFMGAGKPTLFEILPHLTDTELRSARWKVPQVIYPDRREMGFAEEGWDLPPEAPRLGGRVAILVEPSVVSAGETVMGIVEHYDLAERAGEPTAGCNGNVNYIPLPGNVRIMFTGMKVLKHDGSQHHLIGIRPTIPVARTIAGVREGRDEVRDRVIEVLRARD